MACAATVNLVSIYFVHVTSSFATLLLLPGHVSPLESGTANYFTKKREAPSARHSANIASPWIEEAVPDYLQTQFPGS